MQLRKFLVWIRQHKETLSVFALFLVLPILAFWRNFDFTKLNLVFFDADFTGFYYPDFSLGVSLFGRFRDMLWDPYNLLGLPYMGGVDRLGLFYPLKSIFYLLGSLLNPRYRVFLLMYFSLFHITLGSYFMYLFAKAALKLSPLASLLAGIIFGFNGTFVHFIIFPNHILGAIYLPLILYFYHKAVTEGKWQFALWAGVAASPVLLSGYTPIFIYNNLFAFLYLLLNFVRTKKSLVTIVGLIIIANIAAILLSTPVLLPNMENASLSERTQYSLGGSSASSYSPLAAIYYLFPRFFGSDIGGLGTVYGYVGVVPLVLAFMGLTLGDSRSSRVFGFLAIFFLLLSLGNLTFLHQLVYLLVPKYSYFRLPALLHYLVGFCLACLAGHGLQIATRNVKVTWWLKTVLTVLSALLALFLLLAYLAKAVFFDSGRLDGAVSAILLSSIFLFSGAFVLWQMAKFPKSMFLKVLLIAVIVIDLFTLVAGSTGSKSDINPRKFTGTNELIGWLKERTGKTYARVSLHESNARYNSAELQIFQPGGYYGLYPRAYTQLFQPFTQEGGWYDPDSKIMDVAGVKFIVSSRQVDAATYQNVKLARTFDVKDENSSQFMTTSGTMLPVGTIIYVYENLDYFPKLTFFSKAILANDDQEASKLFQDASEREEIVITSKGKDARLVALSQPVGNFEEVYLSLDKYANTDVLVTARIPYDGVLMLNDSFYPGWNVTVDGEQAELLKVDVAFRGVYLPEGVHTVRFYYFPKKLYLGMFVGALSVVGLVIVAFRKTPK